MSLFDLIEEHRIDHHVTCKVVNEVVVAGVRKQSLNQGHDVGGLPAPEHITCGVLFAFAECFLDAGEIIPLAEWNSELFQPLRY
jgi:hypothetical protein